MAGRETGQARLDVLETVAEESLRPLVERMTGPDVLLYSDEASGYLWVSGTGRGHATVCHSAREWARDDDGDGVNEVHNNTLEGLWAGLRNFLRPFRGVSKWYLAEYVGMFAGICNQGGHRRLHPSPVRPLANHHLGPMSADCSSFPEISPCGKLLALLRA